MTNTEEAVARHVTHDEARQIAQRFINGHFGNVHQDGTKNWPRMSIPASPQQDDDLLLCAYIEQNRRASIAAMPSRAEVLEECAKVADKYSNAGVEGFVTAGMIAREIRALAQAAPAVPGDDGSLRCAPPSPASTPFEIAAQIRKVLNGYPYGDGNPWPLDLLTKAAEVLEARPSFGSLLDEAQKIVRAKFVWRRFIDGTPLSNDVPVWMAEFALARQPPSHASVSLSDIRQVVEDARNTLRDADNITYPSRHSAQRVRDVMRELLAIVERTPAGPSPARSTPTATKEKGNG